MHSGEPGAMAELLRTFLGDSDHAPAGDGLSGYTTSYFESSAAGLGGEPFVGAAQAAAGSSAPRGLAGAKA